MLFFNLLFIKNHEINISWFTQKYEAAQLFSTLIIRRNVSCAANKYIRIIYESCDTEDWRKNSFVRTGINVLFFLYIKTVILNCNVFTIFLIKLIKIH